MQFANLLLEYKLVVVGARLRSRIRRTARGHVLCGQMGLAILFLLGKGDMERLGDDDPSVHFSGGPCGLLRRREAHETDSFEASLHDLDRGDGSVRSELLKETLISDGVVQVLDIQIDALEPEK